MRVRYGTPARAVRRATIVIAALLSGCAGGGSGTALPSATPTATVLPTPTIPPIESSVGASLHIQLSNGAATELRATLSGTRLSGPPPDGAQTSYGPLEQPVASTGTAAVDVKGLAPGIWLQQIAVPTTGQQQFHQSLLIADPDTANSVAWTLFGTVLPVNDSSDDGDGTCDQTCTLRDAVGAGNAAVGPALVVFDHTALGTPAEVMAIDGRIDITAAGLTIDGTDVNGNPSPVAEFSQRIFPVEITMKTTPAVTMPPDAEGCPCHQDYGGTLFAAASGVALIGLHIERVYPRGEADICCGDLTLIELGEGGANGRVDTCLLDGGGRAITNAVTPPGETGPATSKDCVKPERTGSTPDNPVVVTNSELSYCVDRGVKVQDDFLLLERNWVHNNLRCAVFAIVPGGNIQAVGNLIEENGKNCPSGAPPNCSGQVVTRPDAPQVAAQGNTSQFALSGNVIRSGPLTGVYWQVDSTGTLTDSFVCGMASSGIFSDRTAGEVSGAMVRGTASVLNDGYGARFVETVGADLGTDAGADAGNNAFAGNPTGADVVNDLRGQSVISAEGNQWASCYPASGATADQCDAGAISDDDTNNSPSSNDRVDVQNPQPQQSTGAVTLTAAAPTSAAAGSLIVVTGTGFDAVSGLSGLTSADCANLAGTNTCSPLHGTCVEFLEGDTWTAAADILGVTPTTVMVRAPFTCTAPTTVRVRRAVLGGGDMVSNELPFCIN